MNDNAKRNGYDLLYIYIYERGRDEPVRAFELEA